MIGLSKNGSLIDSQNIIIQGTIYWFNGIGYGNSVDPNNLISNRGYWIKCNSAGIIKLNLI